MLAFIDRSWDGLDGTSNPFSLAKVKHLCKTLTLHLGVGSDILWRTTMFERSIPEEASDLNVQLTCSGGT